jgi:hypothetical protein
MNVNVMLGESVAVNAAPPIAGELLARAKVDPQIVEVGMYALQIWSLRNAMLQENAALREASIRQGCTPGSKSCFVAGTQVVIGIQAEDQPQALNLPLIEKDGALAVAAPASRYLTQSIEHLRPGETVLCRSQLDPQGPMTFQRIEEVFVRTTQHLQIVTLQSSDGLEQTLHTTNEHPLYVEGKGWVDSRDLMVGDRVPEAGGGYATVTATKYEIHPAGVRVYNFRVCEAHTYFVREAGSQAEPVWVHNYDLTDVRRLEQQALLDENGMHKTTRSNRGMHNPAVRDAADFGTAVHQNFERALMEQTGTRNGDWEMHTKPGQTGIDAIYRGPESRWPG